MKPKLRVAGGELWCPNDLVVYFVDEGYPTIIATLTPPNGWNPDTACANAFAGMTEAEANQFMLDAAHRMAGEEPNAEA